MSVTAGQRYWLHLDCPAPTSGAKGCAVGARFHTEDAPYPLTLTARKLAGRTKGSISCAAITDRDDCCAALDSDDNPCVPAVVPLTPTLTLALTQSLILTLTLTRTRTLTLALDLTLTVFKALNAAANAAATGGDGGGDGNGTSSEVGPLLSTPNPDSKPKSNPYPG